MSFVVHPSKYAKKAKYRFKPFTGDQLIFHTLLNDLDNVPFVQERIERTGTATEGKGILLLLVFAVLFATIREIGDRMPLFRPRSLSFFDFYQSRSMLATEV